MSTFISRWSCHSVVNVRIFFLFISVLVKLRFVVDSRHDKSKQRPSNSKKCPSQLTKARGNIHSNDIQQRRAANCHIYEAKNNKCLTFCLLKWLINNLSLDQSIIQLIISTLHLCVFELSSNVRCLAFWRLCKRSCL